MKLFGVCVALALVGTAQAGEIFFREGSNDYFARSAVSSATGDNQSLAKTPLPQSSKTRPSNDLTNGFHQTRTFRLAIAATGEYTEFHGGTVSSAMAAIGTLVNRVNQIYGQDLGIQFVLVPNNNLVVYTNKNTDPFTSNDPSTTTTQQGQAAFDQRIGNNNYDLGIVLNTGTYGLAYLSSVCDSQLKGSACMGLPQPTGEAFHILVAHEMAHQFGANHTFNSDQQLCSGNRHGSTAVELGSGSTLMSYALLDCGQNSFQPIMDGYFNAESIEEIEAFLNNITLCGTVTTTGNHLPTVLAGPDYAIPKLTPFKLTATGSDPDGDVLSYCWEELDIGPPQMLADPDNGASPLFRSFPPNTNATRIFPKLNSILQNTNFLSEKLPATNRLMHFRVTVRDGQNMGGTAFSDMHVQVVNSSGSFRFTSHNQPGSFRGAQTITWDVAGTTAAPINVTQVNLLLSTNGGQNFSIALATNTANDGVETVNFPNLDCSSARLKIEAVNNIFFDINDAGISLTMWPFFTKIQPVQGGISLRWSRNPAKSYQLQTTATLTNPIWQTLAVSMVASGNEMEVIVPKGTGAAFFRVKEL